MAAKKIRLVVAGYGTMEPEIRDWISAYGLQELTEIHLQPGNLPELYRSSDIYLNSSIHEGFSNAVMEAMAHGLPVVATRCGDIEKQVVHGKNGYLARWGTTENWPMAEHSLPGPSIPGSSLEGQGHQKLYESFGPEPFKQKYITFIQSLKHEQN